MKRILFFLTFFCFGTVNANSSNFKELKQAFANCEKPEEITKNPSQRTEPIDPAKVTKEDIAEMKKTLYDLAIQKGVSKKIAEIVFTLNFNPVVSNREVKQPERTLTFDEYIIKTMPSSKVLDGKKFLLDNFDDLQKIENEYKVEKEIIVTLILIETYLGKVLGNFNILDSLFTLTLTSNRVPFWQSEIINTLILIDRGNTLYTRETKGSWAGAVGMVQFMPSSFMKLAKDGDGDGKIDIINSKMDAFASAANYLKTSGWEYGKPYMRQAKINLSEGEFCNKAGKAFEEGVLVFPDKRNNFPAFVVHKNFAVILTWNRSLFFATTAGIVYNELKNVSKTSN